MRRRSFLSLVAAAMTLRPAFSLALQPKVWTIGVLDGLIARATEVIE